VYLSQAYRAAPENYESLPPNPTYYSTLDDFYLINGRFHPVVTVQPDDVTLFRIVAAISMYVAELQMSPWGICTMFLTSRDGILHQVRYSQINTIILLPGNRADVAIKCPASAVGQNISFSLYPNATRNDQLGEFLRAQQQLLFTLKVVESGNSKIANFPTNFIDAGQSGYLNNLAGKEIYRGPRGIDSIKFDFTPNASINGQSFPGFDMAESEGVVTNFVENLCLGLTYEFTINNTIDEQGIVHPYHHHINPMQVVNNACNLSASYDCDELVRVGEWRDVVPTSGVVIRVRPTMFTGWNVVVHCHYLKHEVEGMMGLYNISSGPGCPATLLQNTSSNPNPPPSDNVGYSIAPFVILLVALVSIV